MRASKYYHIISFLDNQNEPHQNCHPIYFRPFSATEYQFLPIYYFSERGCPLPHLAINNVCNDITNVEECNWDMGNCCGRLRSNDCMICKCHLPLSQALNGTTYQWSAIRHYQEFNKHNIALENHANGYYAGNWQ